MSSDNERQVELFSKKVWKALPSLFIIICIIIIAVLSAGIKKERDRLTDEKAKAIALENPPTNVIVIPLKTSVLSDRINLPGVVEPWTRLQLLAEIQGTIRRVLVSEGQYLRKGELIAQIDEDDYRIALDAAEAGLVLAEADKNRAESLFAKGLLPKSDLDGIDSRLRTAEAARKNAELQLSRCRIIAPISGIIQRLDAKEGLLLSVADPIAEILQVEKVKAVVGIPESDVDAVRSIDKVEVTIQALGGRKFSGRKHFLSSAPENNARLYRLELAIDNSDSMILPGMFLRADIVKSVVDSALALPLYSVLSRNGEHFVYVEEDGAAKRRSVTLGIMEGWMVQVREGLSPGDRLIVEGHRSVEEGHAVKVVRVIDDPGAF